MEFSATRTTLVILSSIDPSPATTGTKGGTRGLIFLRVQKQKEPDICYRIDRNMPLCVLMSDYCDQMGLVYGTIRFTFDGNRVTERGTAADLGMEDEDIIDAWTDMLAG